MRRQRRTHQEDDYHPASMSFESLSLSSDDLLQMERLPRNGTHAQHHRFENTIEAKVEEGDTLQALALRFNCSVADIKRLNKIDKDNEIHARKVIKIPVTVHSVLLGLPSVHKSGTNSPNRNIEINGESTLRNPLEDASAILSEKLIVASVNSAGGSNDINSIILNSKVTANTTTYTDAESNSTINCANDDGTSPLLDDTIVTQPRSIRGPSLRAIEFSGSDCDLSWVCLFVGIMAICFVIPLIYVIHLAEHPPHHNST